MKSMFLVLALLAGQAIAMQDKPIVHLKPHSNTIDQRFRGSLVELSNSPSTVYLPASLPPPDSSGNPWSVDVKNFGPAAVTIVGKQDFTTTVGVSQTIHIEVNGQGYKLKQH